MKSIALLLFVSVLFSYVDAWVGRSTSFSRKSSLSMNIEQMTTKENVRVGVIGT
jgi:hypothetical protein